MRAEMCVCRQGGGCLEKPCKYIIYYAIVADIPFR